MKFWIISLLIVLLPLLSGQVMMVRCDDGSSKEFLSSPSNMNLSSLSSLDTSSDTIVMVHGYLNDFDDCKSAYTSTMNILRTSIGRRNYVGFHWPSKLLWFGTAVENSNKAGNYLVHLLVEITRKYGNNGRKIHLLTHSLGGRVLLNALDNNLARGVSWGTCYTMAIAVHNDSFQSSFYGTNEIPQNFYVFHSSRDGVLKYIYSLYYMFFGRGRESRSPELQAFMELTFEEQIAYLQKLDESLQDDMGFMDDLSELDQELVVALERGKDAMGLSGSQATYKVQNFDVSDIVSGHSEYWGNDTTIRRIAGKM